MKTRLNCISQIVIITAALCGTVLADPLVKVTPASRDGETGLVNVKSLTDTSKGWTRQEGPFNVGPGSRFLTDSTNAAVMEFPDGIKAVLGPQASLNYLGSRNGMTGLSLNKGSARFFVPSKGQMHLEIGSYVCEGSDLEGEAAIDLDHLSVAVFRGSMKVLGPQGETTTLPAGKQFSLAADGKTIQIQPISAASVGAPSSPSAGPTANPNAAPPILQPSPPNPGGQPPVGQTPAGSDVWNSLPSVLQQVVPYILNGRGTGIPGNIPINIPGLPFPRI